MQSDFIFTDVVFQTVELSSYRAVNTSVSVIKANQLMSYTEILGLFCTSYKTQKCTVWAECRIY